MDSQVMSRDGHQSAPQDEEEKGQHLPETLCKNVEQVTSTASLNIESLLGPIKIWNRLLLTLIVRVPVVQNGATFDDISCIFQWKDA